MSANASAGDPGDAEAAPTEYEEMLETIDVAIDECERKIRNGRVRDPQKEKARVKQWRALGYLINVRRQVANDRDLEELAERVETLEAASGRGGRR